MAIYIFIMFAAMLLGRIGQVYSVEKEVRLGHNVQTRKMVPVFATILVCALFTFFYAARWYVGTDFGAYLSMFNGQLGVNLKEIIGTRDWGFYLLTAVIGNYIVTDFFLYSIIIGAIIYCLMVFTYRKYSSDFLMTCALYVSMCLYTAAFNGTRQTIASAILFAGFPLLFERKNWWKYIVVVFLAYTFHSTALMVVPFFILCRLKPWKKPFVFVCIILILLIIFLPGLWTTIIDALQSIGQEKLADDYADLENLRAGVNFLRIVVAAFPVVVSFIYYPILKHGNRHIDFFINMAVFNLLFMICGMRLTVLARFAMYFNLALPVLVAEFTGIFTRKSKTFAKIIILFIYLVHMIILMPNDSHLIPYRFIFGHI